MRMILAESQATKRGCFSSPIGFPLLRPGASPGLIGSLSAAPTACAGNLKPPYFWLYAL
jgi:hypothetical protein